MINLPAIKSEKPKSPYRKSDSVRELERMKDSEARRKHPNHPEGVLVPRRYRDDTCNRLTSCITDYLRLQGAFSSRLNNTGVYDKKLNRYRPTTSKKGLPESESIPSDEQFGYDGSKCFFPHDLKLVKEYFKEFDDKLSGANMPNLLLPKAIKGTFNPSVVLPLSLRCVLKPETRTTQIKAASLNSVTASMMIETEYRVQRQRQRQRQAERK